jgi:DNA-binding transcriptional LysR family regulator
MDWPSSSSSDRMTGKIKLGQLKSYQAIMATGSMSAAAEMLHITQPALSKHLAALEQAIGLRLFDRRSGGPMTPTRVGREFYKSIEGTLDVLERLPLLAQEISTYQRSRFLIAASLPIINSSFFVDGLRRFRSQYPEVRLGLEARHRVDIEELIVTRQADIGFGLLPIDIPGLSGIPLTRVDAVAVMAGGHSLARKRQVTFKDLAPFPLILPSRQPLRTRIDHEIERSGIALDIDLEASSTITCCKFAIEGFGITLCDPFSPTAFQGSDLVVRPLRPAVSLTYGALIADRGNDDPLTESLVTILQKVATEHPHKAIQRRDRVCFGRKPTL